MGDAAERQHCPTAPTVAMVTSGHGRWLLRAQGHPAWSGNRGSGRWDSTPPCTPLPEQWGGCQEPPALGTSSELPPASCLLPSTVCSGHTAPLPLPGAQPAPSPPPGAPELPHGRLNPGLTCVTSDSRTIVRDFWGSMTSTILALGVTRCPLFFLGWGRGVPPER